MRTIPGLIISLGLVAGEDVHAETGKEGNCLLQFRGFKNKVAADGVAQEASGTGAVRDDPDPLSLVQISHVTPPDVTNQTVWEAPLGDQVDVNTTAGLGVATLAGQKVAYIADWKAWVHLQTTTSVLVGFAGAGLAFGVWFTAGLAKTEEALERRNLLVDNCKLVASFLVIYSYFLTATLSGRSHDSQTWLSGAAPWILDLQAAGSMVVVPMICFISGVCSQGPVTATRIRRYLQNLVVPTILWTCVVKPVVVATLMHPSAAVLQERWGRLVAFQAFEAEWYLQALVLWRGSTFLLWSHMRPSVAFLCMLTLSCVGGYHHYNQAPAAWLHVDEAVGFLPYFALGYAVPFERIQYVVAPVGPLAPMVVVLCWTLLGVPQLMWGEPLPEGSGWYGCCDAGWTFVSVVGQG
eukprot:CAMPEP_0204363704 /NCGR_PEP_ID=MMETSP0469-20131031/40570_1 /ASSEMBLY_ACC=CAM_ASM_000384 /TAXON_ID=2969 /ORGANISM="Oxyrrhis marina" /LENGTH=407 /DNA_ID=CAMNT_0051352485 /DNA_START=96 /DNA_END=1316 /DNA_ORIENTATION=+